VDTRKILIAAAIAAALPAAPALAASPSNTATASGKALLLLPLTLTKVNDLQFGTIVSSAVAGTVTINAASGARTHTGGVTEVGSDPGSALSSIGRERPVSRSTLISATRRRSTTAPATACRWRFFICNRRPRSPTPPVWSRWGSADRSWSQRTSLRGRTAIHSRLPPIISDLVTGHERA